MMTISTPRAGAPHRSPIPVSAIALSVSRRARWVPTVRTGGRPESKPSVVRARLLLCNTRSMNDVNLREGGLVLQGPASVTLALVLLGPRCRSPTARRSFVRPHRLRQRRCCCPSGCRTVDVERVSLTVR